MESWMQTWRPRTKAFCDFSSPCLWSIAPATRRWCQVIQSAAPVTKSSSQSWRSDAPKCNPSQEISALTSSLMNMSLALRLPRKMHLSRSRSFSNVPRLPTLLEMLETHVLQSRAPATRNDIWTSKSGPKMWCFQHVDLEMCFAPQ